MYSVISSAAKAAITSLVHIRPRFVDWGIVFNKSICVSTNLGLGVGVMGSPSTALAHSSCPHAEGEGNCSPSKLKHICGALASYCSDAKGSTT